MYTASYADQMNFEVADRFSACAKEQGIHLTTFAVSWVMSHLAITAPIIGAKNLEQLEYSLST